MINPLRLLRLWRAVTPVATLLEEAAMSKSLFKSRIFWANLLSAAAELSGVLTGFVEPGALTLATNIINIALRLVTSQPVTILPALTDDD
jgi:hypothetical protein